MAREIVPSQLSTYQHSHRYLDLIIGLLKSFLSKDNHPLQLLLLQFHVLGALSPLLCILDKWLVHFKWLSAALR